MAADQRWIRVAIVVAVVYPVVGITFGSLAGPGTSSGMRLIWRLAAWLASAVTFAAHLGYERFRWNSSPLRAALHTSLAVALGAFALAVWVNVHVHWSASEHVSPLALLALVIFPVVTGVPAFVAAFVAATALDRSRLRSQRARARTPETGEP